MVDQRGYEMDAGRVNGFLRRVFGVEQATPRRQPLLAGLLLRDCPGPGAPYHVAGQL